MLPTEPVARDYRHQDRLVEAEKAQLGQRVPEPLHERLNRLCDLAYEAGEARRPSLQEMVGAVLLATPLDGARLRQLLADYGRATVKEAVPWRASVEGELIELPKRRPGPRSSGR